MYTFHKHFKNLHVLKETFVIWEKQDITSSCGQIHITHTGRYFLKPYFIMISLEM